jgi:quercetin dioxygenase-like cupin family protein
MDGHQSTIGWNAGRPIEGTPFREVVATADTDGHLVVLAAEMPPGIHIDEHTHDDEDQIIVVLQGTVGASVDGETTTLTQGAVHLMPRGQRHSLWNPGAEPARILDLYTPGGFEQVFVEGGRRALAGEEPGIHP